jgi:hypothetical protein
MDTSALTPMRPVAATEVREGRRTSPTASVIRIFIGVAAPTIGLVAHNVLHLPGSVVFAVGGVVVGALIVLSISIRLSSRRRRKP